MSLHAAAFAAVFVALFVAHQIGDLWVQTNRQAAAKGQPGWVGRLACAAHVASYTVTAFAAIVVLDLCTGLREIEWRVILGLAVSAVTHYIADRRTPLLRLAEFLQPVAGKADFYRLGVPRPGRDDNPSLGTGAYALDQSWHIGWLFVAALIIAS